MDLPFYREYELPWASGSSQERRFKRVLGIAFLIAFVLGIVWPFIPVPEPDPMEVIEIPPRIAQLMLEEKPIPPPPPPEPEPEEPEPEASSKARPLNDTERNRLILLAKEAGMSSRNFKSKMGIALKDVDSSNVRQIAKRIREMIAEED